MEKTFDSQYPETNFQRRIAHYQTQSNPDM